MARLQAKKISIPSGKALFFDPLCLIPEDKCKDCETMAFFEHPYVTSDGDYKIYTDGSMYVIDVHPRIFKAKTRSSFTKLKEVVSVDYCSIGVADLESDLLKHIPQKHLESQSIIEVTPGDYYLWFEQKGDNYFRGLIGFGASTRLIVNGEYANEVQEIEKDISLFLRGKKSLKDCITERILSLHSDGCKDKRLKQLADLLKLKLPKIKK